MTPLCTHVRSPRLLFVFNTYFCYSMFGYRQKLITHAAVLHMLECKSPRQHAQHHEHTSFDCRVSKLPKEPLRWPCQDSQDSVIASGNVTKIFVNLDPHLPSMYLKDTTIWDNIPLFRAQDVPEGTEAALRVESVAARRARRHLQMHRTRIQQHPGDATVCWYAADTPL